MYTDVMLFRELSSFRGKVPWDNRMWRPFLSDLDLRELFCFMNLWQLYHTQKQVFGCKGRCKGLLRTGGLASCTYASLDQRSKVIGENDSKS